MNISFFFAETCPIDRYLNAELIRCLHSDSNPNFLEAISDISIARLKVPFALYERSLGQGDLYFRPLVPNQIPALVEVCRNRLKLTAFD
jgi:hypothetical protein